MAIIKTLQNSQTLAREASMHIIECANEAISDHGYFSIALAGGSTPKATFEMLATVEFAPHIEWEKVHVFWSDERCVAPNHEESNYRMAFNVLLRHSPIPVKQIYRMEGELDPKDAAQAYETKLHSFFGQKPPRFDLILLGLGEDGHTASLFPESKALLERKHWIVANYVRKFASWRLTMTYSLINQAANVSFLVSGKNKAQILRRVLAGRYTPEEIPAQGIRPDRGQLRWFIDADAAMLL